MRRIWLIILIIALGANVALVGLFWQRVQIARRFSDTQSTAAIFKNNVLGVELLVAAPFHLAASSNEQSELIQLVTYDETTAEGTDGPPPGVKVEILSGGPLDGQTLLEYAGEYLAEQPTGDIGPSVSFDPIQIAGRDGLEHLLITNQSAEQTIFIDREGTILIIAIVAEPRAFEQAASARQALLDSIQLSSE